MTSRTIAALALRGADSMLGRRTRTTMGLRFPEDETTGLAGRYGESLYRGTSGVGIAVLDVAAATGERTFLDLADEIRDGFIESVPPGGTLKAGLYEGAAGIALFHLARARLLGEADSLTRAAALVRRLADVAFVETDVVYGAAGMGLLQLAMYHATRDDDFLEHARRCAAFLHETAAPVGDGVAWPIRDPRQPLLPGQLDAYAGEESHLHTGLAHGTAGVCLFLVELHATGRAPDAMPLAKRGMRWLEAQTVTTSAGLLWPWADVRPVTRTHWCHGSTGIAQLYLALHRHGARDKALELAAAAGDAVWAALRTTPNEPSCHCHGLAGAMELFLDLAAHGAGSEWCERAGVVASRLSRRAARRLRGAAAATTSDAPACPFGTKSTGLSVGTAGVVRVLLRAAGHSVFPILPDGHRWTARCDVAVAPKIASSEMHREQRLTTPIDCNVADTDVPHLVPRAAARLATGNRLVVLGAPDLATARDSIRLLAARPAGHAYGRAVRRITAACERIADRHSPILAPGSLTPRTFGALAREIAGLVCSPDADADKVASAAERMTTNEIRAMETMLDHVANDLPASLRHVADGRLTAVEVGGGDSHGGGRHVVRLTFENGRTLLYKPRSVAVDRELAGASNNGDRPTLAGQTASWLSASIPGGRLPTHRLIAADPWHGYAEHIASPHGWPVTPDIGLAAGCDTPTPAATVARIAPGDERRFWYSAGLFAGQAFTLGAHDLHVENVMCGHSESTPELALHAVDLEVAFGLVDDLSDTLLVEPPKWGDAPPAADRHTHAAFDATVSFLCGVHAEDWSIELTRDGPRPTARLKEAVRWHFPQIAQNPDGSYGYGPELCAFLRGFADQWTVLQTHAAEVADHLRTTLTGVPARILCKRTLSYLPEIMRRKRGGPAHAGASFDARNPALPLLDAELAQIDQLDYPYFFQFLGEHDGPRRGTYWKPGPRSGARAAHDFDEIPRHTPFWSIVERQASEERFACAVIDAVRFVAPPGVFDMHDRDLGVRATRREGDSRLWIVILLGNRRDERLTVRVGPQGDFEWWRD